MATFGVQHPFSWTASPESATRSESGSPTYLRISTHSASCTHHRTTMDNQVSASDPSTAPASAPTVSVLRPLRVDTTVPPRSETQRVKVLAALSRIASVEVAGPVVEDGHNIYVITVELDSSQPSMPQPGSKETLPQRAGSQIQTKHSFREFTNLRREMFFHAHSGHRDDANNTPVCDFCTCAVEFLSQSLTLPRLWKRFFKNSETLRHQLENFLNVALQIATKANTHSAQWCEGEEMVPLLMKKFLLGDAGEEDTSDLMYRANNIAGRNDVFLGWGF